MGTHFYILGFNMFKQFNQFDNHQTWGFNMVELSKLRGLTVKKEGSSFDYLENFAENLPNLPR
jgi:hypothetical protein